MNTMKKDGVINKMFGAACLLAATFGLAVQVQAVNPIPDSILIDPSSAPANGLYFQYGEDIMIQVVFNIPIDVFDGAVGTSPYLSLNITPSSSNRAVYDGVSGNTLYLKYTVQAGDYAFPLAYPSDLSLQVSGTTVIYDASGAAANPGDRWNRFTNRIPAPGAATALDASNIEIRTVSITPAAATILAGDTQLYTVSRGGPRTTTMTVNLSSSFPSVGAVPASVTIPAGAVTVQFSVTGLSTGLSTLTADAYPLLLAIADETATLTVNPGPAPTFTIQPPIMLYEGVNFDPATYPYMGSGTIRLSRTPIAPITITLTSANPASLAFVGGVNTVQFLAGETNSKPFSVQGLDGNQAVAISGVDLSGTYVTDGAASVVTVLNVPPLLNSPADPWTLANGTEGQPVSFSWSGTDVAADILNPLQVYIDYGDGNNSGWINGDAGSVAYIYASPGQFGVTLRLRDQDGGEVTRTSQIIIDPATEVLFTEVVRGNPAGLPPGYHGLAGLGMGSIDDSIVGGAPKLAVPGAQTNVFTIKYSPLQPSVVFVATPNPFDIVTGNKTNTYDSFFHVWVGDGFMLAGATEPIANPTARLELNGTDRDVQGVFSREFDPLDNYGDIDLDALPDKWEDLWWPGTRPFETPNRAGNDDEDFLPHGANATMAYPATGGNYTPDGAAFGNVLEVRGLNIDLNALLSDVNPTNAVFDEPKYLPTDDREFFGTDPTVPDTDGDGFSDGWEYYFWMNATNRGITGLAYNPGAPMQDGAIIPSALIVRAFDPLVPGNPAQDLDGDGLSNMEEYGLGTDPINWDSDGDTMADGWEVFRNLDPHANDSGGNPDGDFMAALGWDLSMPRDDVVTPLLFSVHFNVYDSENYDPRTGWGATYTLRSRATAALAPNTAAMLNIDEYAIMQFWINEGIVGAVTPKLWDRLSTNPQSNDTDGDGAADGWEAYVHFDPAFNQAGILWDIDMDGSFLGNEFAGVESSPNSGVRLTIGSQTTTVTGTNTVGSTTNTSTTLVVVDSTPLANVNEPWWNKFWPSDPNNADTDGDYVGDGAERGDFSIGPFLYTAPAEWNTDYIRGARAGGGLNPCCVDTDMDFIPDAWEVQYRYDIVQFMNPDGSTYFVGGMDGSIFDSRSGLTDLTSAEENYDYDSDGLENYQEYYVNAMWHFNYDKWVSGLGSGAYPPAGLMMGTPKAWDWATAANYWEQPIYEGMSPPMHTPFVFILPEPRPMIPLYASADPSNWDTDGDGMDDHYEMFYALNPLWSESLDLIAKGAPTLITDIRVQPWAAGAAMSDADQDGIPNWEEAIFPSRPAPANLNSSPSPHWVTDTSYEQSWVNLYYRPTGHSWFWFPGVPGDPVYPYPAVVSLAPFPPTYVYSFANDEGYDTDNDNIPDRMEVTGANNVGLTDITDFDNPRLRKALHVDGQSAARTRFGVSHELNQLRSWTVELWVRAEQPVSPTGQRQILIERPLQGQPTDPMPAPELVRRTFRVGLEPDGRVFAEYNNMGNELLSENIKGTGWTLQSNTWYHVAAALDGDNKQFSLYINGELAARKGTALIPATGVIDANPPFVIPAPIVIGSADSNPNGLVQNPVPGSVTPPDLNSFFKGWVDEVRVWHGGRTQAEIVATMMHRFTMDDVITSITNYAAAQAAADDLNPPDMGYQIYTNLPPVVLYHYAFDNLPDPKHDSVVPQGFELLNGRPSDGSYAGVPWWWQAPDRSRVYSDYRFVQWSENTVSHVPVISQVNRFGNVVDYQFGIVFSSPFWTSPPWVTNTAPNGTTFAFPNKTFPSQEAYFTAETSLLEGGRTTTDLLPLWYAQADMDVPLWDNNTPGVSDYDSNGDGIADWWCVRHGFDPYGASIAGGDADGDGLSNYWEYRLGTDPNAIHSQDTTGLLTDAQYDSDGDGLSNADEILVFGTDPTLIDTDNDGANDFDEIHAHSDPLDSLVPLTNRVLSVSGAVTDYVRLPEEDRFAMTNWVLEAWVNPSSMKDAEIVARQIANNRYNYYLGLHADGRPVVGFNSSLTTNVITYLPVATNLVPVGEWTHVRGGYDAPTRTLFIEINGFRYADETVVPYYPAVAEFGPVETRVGRGFDGMLDDIRIWSQEPPVMTDPALVCMRPGSSDILKWNYAVPGYPSSGKEAGLVSLLRFDDGIIAPMTAGYNAWAWNVVQDFAAAAGVNQWLNHWVSSARIVGAATVIGAPVGTPTDIMFLTDENSDGLPDWWQRRYWSSFVTGDSGDGEWAPMGDPDGDGLHNINEYLADLNPREFTTDNGSTIADGLRDADADGLDNLFEQNMSATRVDLPDTDDDGYTDYEEETGSKLAGSMLGMSNPTHSLDPMIPRGLSLDGNSRMVVRTQKRHAMTEWTMAAWVQPNAGSDGGVVIARTFEDGSVNYEMGIEDDGGVLRPYVRYDSRTGGVTNEHRLGQNDVGAVIVNNPYSGLEVEPDAWTHVATIYSPSNSLLSLYVDGHLVATRADAVVAPLTGIEDGIALAGELTVGGGALDSLGTTVLNGFEGAIDDVRMMNIAGDASVVLAMMDGQATGQQDPPVTNAVMTAAAPSEETKTAAPAAAPEVVPGEFLVGLSSKQYLASVKAQIETAGMQVQRTYKSIPAMHVKLAEGDNESLRLQSISAMANVRYVEPNYKLIPAAIPDDPSFGELWGLNNTGQSGGTDDADIDAAEAWDVKTGGNVVVAVIDSGLDYSHPDLAANMWVNPGETAGNGIDDDNNGYVDDVNGYDFGAGDNDTIDDVIGHGTHCSGTIGAVGNNGEGICGVSWNVKLMACKIADAAGGLSSAAAIEAIEYAVKHGARVSNNSWGGTGFSQALYDAVRAAGEQDHLFVAAAGNSADDNDQIPHYPSSFDLDNVIAVAATDRNDKLADFSCYGLTSVDLGAPGVAILSTLPLAGSQMGQNYGEAQGTSMATPHVTGAAALLLAVDSTMSAVALKTALLDNADPIPSLDGKCVTGARLNLFNALPKGGGGGGPVVIRGMVAWFKFDDGGAHAEDFSLAANWNSDWRYAGQLEGTAAMTNAAAQMGIADSDADGLPDWWEEAYGLNPLDATGDNGAASDPDGDGLTNMDEYRISLMLYARGERGLNPMLADSDLDGSDDGMMDSDADGLTNLEEVRTHLTNPALPDTDDDGLTDKEEVDRALDPLDCLMPYIMRFVRNVSGAGLIEVPGNVRGKDADGARFNLNEWTIEATVRLAQLPSVTGNPVVLVSRRCKPYGNLTFELGIGVNDRAYVRFHSEASTPYEYRLESVALMTTGTWVSVAGRLSHEDQTDRQQLDIFVDSSHDSKELTNASVALGVQDGPLVMAQGLRGDIDEVRIWNVSRSNDEIDRLRRRKLHFGEDVATMGVLNVNGGLLHRSFNQDIRLSTWTAEAWFKSVSAGLVMQRAAGTGDDGVPIYNYRINIKDDGYIEAEFAFNTLVLITGVGPRYRWATVTLNASSRRVDRGQWHFVSLSYDGRDAILYLDGVVEDRVTIDPVANLPALGLPYWHMLAGEATPPSSYLGEPAVMATQEGVFRAGLGMQGQLDEIRVFAIGSTQAQIDQRRFLKVTPTEAGLKLYYDFDDLDDLTAERVADKANIAAGIADLLQGASLDSGSGVNCPIEFSPLQILAPKLAAYFPMDEGTYTRLSPPRGFDGHQVKDFLRKLDFDFAGTFTRSDVYFMYNDASKDGLKYTQDYLANTDDWLNDTYFITDADGDGMPDWWEVLYGLDPNRVATPDNARLGPYGDPDKDGLGNLSECLARTDPFNRDTTRSGFGDYDSRLSAFEPTFGQRFDDGDRIADEWEVLYMYKTPATLNRSLDPVYYDANLDPDEDRWSNYAEFMANTDPTDPLVYPAPLVRVTARYSGRYGDDLADVIAAGVTTTNTNAVVVITNVVTATGIQLHLQFYDTPMRDGFTTATVMTGTAVTELRTFDSGHPTEGMNYVFAFLDMNDDNEWDPVEEPAGIASFNMGWGDWNEVEIPLTDDRQMRGFPRLRWDPVPVEEQAVTLGYMVTANQGPFELFSRYIENPMRTYLHEGDYLDAGLDGFGGDGSTNSITFYVYKNNTVYGYDFETPHKVLIAIVTDTVTEKPVVVTGHDITFAYARNELAWTMDPDATWYQMTFRANGSDSAVDLTGSALLQTGHLLVPFRDVNGQYRADLPFYAGDVRADGTVWTNGRYWVKITTGMELGGTSSSEWVPFNLGVREPDENDAKSMIEGKLYNFGGHDFFSDTIRRDGAVSNQMPVIVQSFSNPGFSGVPDAQVTIDPTAWVNTEYRYEAVFQLKGLHRGSHYIRAFVDSNGNGLLDEWETWGFNRDIQTYYEPLRISLESAGVMRVQDQMIIIRDRDTDDDGLPDIWEYHNYGTPSDDSFLALYGSGSAGANSLLLSTRWQYGLDAFSNVTFVDVNVNGISDEWELYYFGTLLSSGASLADVDGDGMSAYQEYINGSDPTNPGESLRLSTTLPASGSPVLIWSGVSNYRVMVTDSLMATWVQDNNLANYARVAIGGGAYTWTYTDPAPPVGASRFYRVVIVDPSLGTP